VPELPEVETIVQGLRAPLTGALIQRVVVHRRDLLREPSARFRSRMVGTTIKGVRRRGKNIVLELSEDCSLVVNLGMTGRILLLPSTPRPGSSAGSRSWRSSAKALGARHPGVSFLLHGLGTLLYDDVRRFGVLRCMSNDQWKAEADRLGPEPLDPELSPKWFWSDLSRSRTAIRNWLLDQRKLAGVGNIYANEALFRAKIHPARPANSIGRAEAQRLLTSIQSTLEDAIRARGTTLRDYRTASSAGCMDLC
jgi:formamidopyrimidine-DNA glycosylase